MRVLLHDEHAAAMLILLMLPPRFICLSLICDAAMLRAAAFITILPLRADADADDAAMPLRHAILFSAAARLFCYMNK